MERTESIWVQTIDFVTTDLQRSPSMSKSIHSNKTISEHVNVDYTYSPLFARETGSAACKFQCVSSAREAGSSASEFQCAASFAIE